MSGNTSVYVKRRTLMLMILPVFILVLGISFALAQQPDGRINQVAHFGGDALYCLDANYRVTVQYPSSEGGFRLLNKDGQELWFVSYTEVAAALDEAVPGGAPVLVASGQGSYGPTELYTFEVGRDDVYFTFTGYDEHGKTNSLTFKFCIPVYGAAQPDQPGTSVPPTPSSTEEPTPEPLCVVDIGFDENENPVYYFGPCDCPEPMPLGESGYFTCNFTS